MDTNTGVIYDSLSEGLKDGVPEERLKKIDSRFLTNRQKVLLATGKNVKCRKSEPCPCGSKKKFKTCCLTTI